MRQISAAVVDNSAPYQVAIHKVEAPVPALNEALIRVVETSMTPGEIWYSQSGIPDRALGCDIVGIVEKPAVDGSGPAAGARVIGRVKSGAWAELAAVPTDLLAELPDDVTNEQAATLPTSGLTALRVLDKGGSLLEQKVLITAANGAVGLFECQIAKLMEATVTAQVRREKYSDLVTRAGADHVVVSEDGSAASALGPYKLIGEAVGGQVLSNSISMLAPDGICVSFGNISNSNATFDPWELIEGCRTSIYGFIISNEFGSEMASVSLSRLTRLVSEGKVKTHIAAEESIDNISKVAEELAEHKIEGKVVIKMWM